MLIRWPAMVLADLACFMDRFIPQVIGRFMGRLYLFQHLLRPGGRVQGEKILSLSLYREMPATLEISGDGMSIRIRWLIFLLVSLS